MQEVIDKIKNAEQQAEKAKADAHKQAEQMQTQAKADGKKRMEENAAKANEQAGQVIRLAQFSVPPGPFCFRQSSKL